MISLYRDYENHPAAPIKAGDVVSFNLSTGLIEFRHGEKVMSFGSHVRLQLLVPPSQTNDLAIFIANMAELGVRPLPGSENIVRYMFTERPAS